MPPITVLHLAHSLDPGGAERMAVTVARHLSRERFRPVVTYFRGHGPLAAELKAEGIPVYGLGKRHRGAVTPLLRLARILKRERVAILHAHNWSPNVWGRLVGRAMGVPVVITTEHSVADARGRAERWVERLLAPLSDRIVAVSEAVASSHQLAEGIPRDRFVALHNAVLPPSLPDRASARRRLHLPLDEPVLLCLGRLDPPKGQTYLLKAMPAILRHVPTARLLFAGDGRLRAALEAEAQRLALNGQVRFLGYRADVAALLAAADLLVIPSTREGIPLALLEAMAAGLPVVATDVGGIPEAVRRDETGLLVPPGDPTALAAAAAALLRDPVRARTMGERGRARYHEQFTVERLVQETEALYNALWSQRRAAA